MPIKQLRQLSGLNSGLKRMNQVAKNKKKLLRVEDFNP